MCFMYIILLNPTMIPQKDYDYSHFTGEKTELQS